MRSSGETSKLHLYMLKHSNTKSDLFTLPRNFMCEGMRFVYSCCTSVLYDCRKPERVWDFEEDEVESCLNTPHSTIQAVHKVGLGLSANPVKRTKVTKKFSGNKPELVFV